MTSHRAGGGPRSAVRAAARLGVVGVVAVATVSVTAGWPAAPEARAAPPREPTKVTYVVVPHPDDEFEAWGLVERRPRTYKVFITATLGEETGFCDPRTYREVGYQEGLEAPARPTPRGRWTTSCERARLGSWLAFFTRMARSDPTLPGDLASLGTRGPFRANGVQVCRFDGDEPCARSTVARVWVDRQRRGALVAFDLGDGDLTWEEAAWAIRTVQRRRRALGLDRSLPDGPLVAGAFWNAVHGCHRLTHPDHGAVQQALRRVDFGVAFQAAPTCRDDPRARRFPVVSRAGASAAFKVAPDGTRLGAHTRHYGWLSSSYYRLDRTAQRRIFHTHQAFWVRRRR